MNRLKPSSEVFVYTLTAALPNFLIGRTDVEHLAVISRNHPENLRDMLGKLAKLLFTLPQCLLCLLTLSHFLLQLCDRLLEFSFCSQALLNFIFHCSKLSCTGHCQ